MASHIEMSRLAGDPTAVRALARSLQATQAADWTDWESDFLEHMAEWPDCDGERQQKQSPAPLLSERQREKLIELRDAARSYSTFEGYAVANLVRNCWLARFDLSEGHERFVDQHYRAGTTWLKHRPMMLLLNCALQLGLIDRHSGIN